MESLLIESMIEYTYKKVTTARAVAGATWGASQRYVPTARTARFLALHTVKLMEYCPSHFTRLPTLRFARQEFGPTQFKSTFKKQTVTHWTTVRPQTFFFLPA